MGLPVSQVKSGERGTARQKEAVFALEEGAQEILLQCAELAICQLAQLSATGGIEIPRSCDDGQGAAQQPASAARPLRVR